MPTCTRWLATAALLSFVPAFGQMPSPPKALFGYRDFTKQAQLDHDFLAVPDARLAGEELKQLTAAPHVAASKEDYDTAVYVADKFKAAGLETTIVPYKAWLNLPQSVSVEATDSAGHVLITGPSKEHVSDDSFQDDPRVLPAFNGSSPSGDVTGDVVYANYGTPDDFKKLADEHIDLKGKIVLVRYGGNFRGVKVYIAEQRGVAGVLIYSDPYDDGYFQGDVYPKGPYRPDSAVQRGSVQYLFRYPGDATTPGVASTPELPNAQRLPLDKVANMPTIPSMPLSYKDARPILEHLSGPGVPHGWQGALPFAYHMGGDGSVRVHLAQKMEYAERTIWDVIGRIPGTDGGDDWVVAGNHRDAWAYGAVDPNSGTAAMLEAVHGLGALLKAGWKPKRSIYFGSWDAEEEGLIGSTEWVEDHARQMEHAVAYFNTDMAVSGPDFEASAVPSLKQFVRDVALEVPSAKGGSVLDAWKAAGTRRGSSASADEARTDPDPNAPAKVGDLGSGSDFTPFLQHAGVPSTDIGSRGRYGVYHSVFDNYEWFTKFADPTFVYEQQMARVLGLEVLHMADADVLPYDYVAYARDLTSYLKDAEKKGEKAGLHLNFTEADAAVAKMQTAAEAALAQQQAITGKAGGEANLNSMNTHLRQVETDLLDPEGLPGRTWFHHTIYAPGEYTGYAAVVIPGVSEAIEANKGTLAQQQLDRITAAIHRATGDLQAAVQ